MKGIMRKRLVALLSLAGFAGSATPVTAQVLKGSDQADTKKESTVKDAKAAQENAATNTAIQDKRKDAAAESNARKNAKTIKMRKAGGEQEAAQDVVNEKVGSDQKTRKAGGTQEDANAKFNKAAAEANALKLDKAKKQMGDGSVKPGAQATIGSATGGAGAGKAKFNDIHVKGEKSAAETNAATGDHIKKAKNNAAEGHAAQQDANKKAAKQADQPK